MIGSSTGSIFGAIREYPDMNKLSPVSMIAALLALPLAGEAAEPLNVNCLLYTSPSPRD